jgi:hypothetical protein
LYALVGKRKLRGRRTFPEAALAGIPGLSFAFVTGNLFQLESLHDCWRKGAFSSKDPVEGSAVDP